MAFSQCKPIYIQLSELLKDLTWSEEKQAWTSTSETIKTFINVATGPKSEDQYVNDKTMQMLVCYLGIKVIAPESGQPMRCDTRYEDKHLFKANKGTGTGTFTFDAPTERLKKRFGILVTIANTNAASIFASKSHEESRESGGAATITPLSPS